MTRPEDEAIKNATAKALKAMREKRNLSKSEVARRAGTSYVQVDRWETARTTPGTLNLAGLAVAYGMDTPKLFGEVARAIDEAKQKINKKE